MRLKSLTISGFKNLGLTRITPDHPVTAIISPNNYGKSNLLESIRFAVDFMAAGHKARASMMAWESGIPITPETENDPFRFEMELEEAELNEYRHIRYGFSFRWLRDDGSGQRILDEWLDMRENESVRYSKYLDRPKGKYRKGKSTKSFRNIVLERDVLAIDILPSVEDLEYGGALRTLRRFEYRVCDTIDVNQRFALNPFSFQDEDNRGIRFDDEDIPRAIHRLQNLYPRQYLGFEDAVHTLFPDFEDISVRAFDVKVRKDPGDFYFAKHDDASQADVINRIPFHVKDTIYRVIIRGGLLNQPVSLERMSSGTKRMIWLLANVYIASCTGVHCIGVEELETSVHPQLIRRLLEVIRDGLEDTRLIISSHSPYIVQYLNLSHIYVGVASGTGVARFRPIRKSKQGQLLSAAHAYDLSVGEYLFELMSREDEGAEILEKYLGGPRHDG